MYPEGPNPSKVQSQSFIGEGDASLPLVLLHDGGGTTFGYWMLDSLNRDVWAVHNPRFWTGQPWDGGVNEMARHYITLLRNEGIHGAILLGGWSLGGYLSVTMARMLAQDGSTDITIKGLLLIDSPYHVPWAGKEDPYAGHSNPLMENLPPLVQTAFDQCEAMLKPWAVPSWDSPVFNGEDMQLTAAGQRFQLKCGTILYKPIMGNWITVDRQMHPPKQIVSGFAPPPAVMLRCTRRKEVADGTSKPCRIDAFRDDPLLGWEQNYPSFIKVVLELDSDHYGIFDKYDGKHVSGGVPLMCTNLLTTTRM
jgi:hypothetical protein